MYSHLKWKIKQCKLKFQNIILNDITISPKVLLPRGRGLIKCLHLSGNDHSSTRYMKQNKGGHPVIPVEKSDNSASGKHLCVSKCMFESLWTSAAHGKISHEPGLDLSQHSSDSNHPVCFSGHAYSQGQNGSPGGRTASNLRWWPPQESEQQVPCCWKRFNGYLYVVASQQTKKLPQSSETGTVSLLCYMKNTPAIQWWE